MNQRLDPNQILQQSSLIYSALEMADAMDDVAEQINSSLGSSPVVMICVMSGGLYFSGQMLARLNMPVELDYVQANRYQKELSGGELVWTKLPSLDLTGKIVILLDDILDEGLTLHGVYHKCLELGASKVVTVVLADKLNGYAKPIKADYSCVTVPNQFVFGCGMDAYGWWRNLPEIRALTIS
jgi:hypoxanthine phosphoribosyltransferase